MDPVEALAHFGGAASRDNLLRLTTPSRLRTAIAQGRVIAARRGRYRVAGPDPALRNAVDVGGVISHLSAATRHGWETLREPARPQVTVPPHQGCRSIPTCTLTWRDLTGEAGPITSPLRTALDCARDLPFREGLAVADSGLRSRAVDAETFERACHAVRGPGAPQARRIAACASARAANPFESALRAIALEAGFEVRPQVPIELGRVTVHPDVVDESRRLALEAESWEWHAGREAFDRDCWRYTALVVKGWTVLRFTWWQVNHDPAWVTTCLDAMQQPQPAEEPRARRPRKRSG